MITNSPSGLDFLSYDYVRDRAKQNSSILGVMSKKEKLLNDLGNPPLTSINHKKHMLNYGS